MFRAKRKIQTSRSSRHPRSGLRHRLVHLACVALTALACLLSTAAASAAEPAAHLELEAAAYPTSFSSDDCPAGRETINCDQFRITAYSTGEATTSGQVTLTDELPSGLVIQAPPQLVRIPVAREPEVLPVSCGESPHRVSCTARGSNAPLAPDEALQLRVYVRTEPGAASAEVNVATLSGIGTAQAGASSIQTPITIASPPPFGVSSLFTSLTDAAGEPLTQAGAHPFEYRTRFRPTTRIQPSPESLETPTSVEDLRDAVVDLPPGLVGSAEAAPKCAQIQLTTLAGCPPASKVGYIFTEPEALARINSAIYNIVPEQGVAAEFGFTDVLDNVHFIYASVVPGSEGYVVRASTPETPQIALSSVIATFYGDPSARAAAAEELPPMFSMPADCSGRPLQSSIHIDSWQNPGPLGTDGTPDLTVPRWASATTSTPAVIGCEELHFEPSIEARPVPIPGQETRADSPTGLDVTLKVPQSTGAEELATPPLKKAVVRLPEGVAVNPSAANGLGACSLAQVGFSAAGVPDAAQPACPDDSKVGTVELETPVLPGVLGGDIYVARQTENPFGSLLAIYIVVDDPTTGVLVKLAGKVEPDPQTGRLTAVVDDNPQLPFSELRTHFFSGNRATLRTPAICGTTATSAELTPWSAPQSGPAAAPSAPFTISVAANGGSCPTSPGAEPDHPVFSAGSTDPLAGAYAPFVLKASRADGDQPITRVNVTLPKGLTGKLAGIPYCPEAAISLARSREHLGGGQEEISSPACPAASEVGVVHVGAGAGPEPYYVTGHVYLAGPYEGAPLSVVIVSPAVAGPFDLGTVVVRAALQLNLETAQIDAVSDPIPTILHGIPLDVRSISLEMSRHEFTLNPTNCEKQSVLAEALGQFGGVANLTDPFQVVGCKNLAFKPKLQVSLKGSTKRAGHPALKATVTYPKGAGYANIAYAQVALPGTEFLDQANLNKVCTQPQLRSDTCPKSSVYGTAKAWSPLLEAPLEGPVYLGVGFGYKLPALVADLNGQIRILLHGKVDTDSEKGIRNTFELVPDAPVSRFVLSMKGGPKYGLLENTAGVCAKPQKAAVKFIAQNGIVKEYRQKIQNGCGKKAGKDKKSHGKSKGNHNSRTGKSQGGHR
jgi:hypothetical protein